MGAPIKVLLVEDHSDTRHALAKLLAKRGFEVVQAESVAQGIALADGQAAALLDLHLPDGLGIEILNHIRKFHPSVRTAFLTASYLSDQLNVELAKADMVFAKPVHLENLVEWLNKPQ